MTYVEAKFGLRIRDAKPGDATSRAHFDPMDVDAVNSLSSGKGKASSSPREGCFKCGGAHHQRDCNARKGKSKQSSGKGKQSGKSWSKSEGKGRSKENKGKSEGQSKGVKGATNRTRVNARQLIRSRNMHRCIPLTTLTQTILGVMTVGVTLNGMMTGIKLDGMKAGIKLMTTLQAHFHLEVLMLVP